MTAILLVAVVVLLIASAFFVAAEFSLVAAQRTRIEPLAASSARARATLAAMEDVSVMMACAQLGITACGVLLGAVGEPAVAHLLHPAFASAGLSEVLAETVSVVIALVLVVSAHVALGEMVPKNIALAGPERVAMILAPMLWTVTRLISPIVRGLNACANGIVRLLGRQPSDEVASAFTREDVAAMVAQSAQEGLLDPEDERLIGSALDFEEGTVTDVMVPRDALVTVAAQATAGDVERACARSGFSRFPVVAPDGRDLVGFVHVRDALKVAPDARDEPLPAESVRTLPQVADGTPMRAAADAMRVARAHMAAVMHGQRWLGVVMLEDVLETLIGDVVDATRRAQGGTLG